MNAKFEAHLNLAESVGVKNIVILKKAFRNLEKNERAISRKYNLDTMVHTFYITECDDDPSLRICSAFFMLKGSNKGERSDAIMDYIFAATPSKVCEIENMYDIPVKNEHVSIKMKKHRSEKWRNGRK